jgi:hypothetical protein
LTIAVAISGLLLKHQIDSKTCRAMNDEFEARLHRLKQNAAKRLPIGASKDEVARFFSENNMSLEIRPVDAGREAAGTFATSGGCPPFGCGNNEALIFLRIRLDDGDQVSGPPVVDGMYTDCM